MKTGEKENLALWSNQMPKKLCRMNEKKNLCFEDETFSHLRSAFGHQQFFWEQKLDIFLHHGEFLHRIGTLFF